MVTVSRLLVWYNGKNYFVFYLGVCLVMGCVELRGYLEMTIYIRQADRRGRKISSIPRYPSLFLT